MRNYLKTIIKNNKGIKKVNSMFYPSLSLEIALRENMTLNSHFKNEIVNNIEDAQIKEDLWSWGDKVNGVVRPADLDDTLVARNVFYLVEKPINKPLNILTSNEGGAYTYLENWKTNNVDYLINLRLLDSINNLELKTNKDEEIFNYVYKNKEKVFENVNEVSKYYLSEGFYIYAITKVKDILDINIEEIINYKKTSLKGKTDVALALISNPKNNDLQELYSRQKDDGRLYLFQQKRYNYKFRNKFFEDKVNEIARQYVE